MWRLLPKRLTPEFLKAKVPSKGLVLVTAFVLIFLIDALDYMTRFPFHLSALMLAPISLVAWYVGFWPAIAYSILGSSYVVFNFFETQSYYPNLLVPIWNLSTLFLFFCAFCRVLDILKREFDRNARMAFTDHLSGLLNGRAFLEALERERARCQRHGHCFSFCMLDLDNFKKVNDSAGHLKGDEILKALSEALKRETRESDLVARLGGDEFAILLPETGMDAAVAFVFKLRGTLSEALNGNEWAVTPSIGLVSFYEIPENVNEILHIADVSRYMAKSEGKNRIKRVVIGRRAGDPKGISYLIPNPRSPYLNALERVEAPVPASKVQRG